MKRNGYASMVRTAKAKSKRRRMDDYETPENVTHALTQYISFTGPIMEPACGSGRMMRELTKRTGRTVYGFDLKKGHDFTKSIGKWRGDIVTNPPYRDNLPEIFARKALDRASGRVALLVEGKWLWGAKRAKGLFSEFIPEAIIVLSSRIYFFQGKGKPIDSQFFSHCWVVWPQRSRRKRMCPADTHFYIVDQNEL